MKRSSFANPPQTITKEKFEKTYRKNWHSWPTARLGETLAACGCSHLDQHPTIHVQRAVRFRLHDDHLKKLRKIDKDYFLRFHFGARSTPQEVSSITDTPVFMIFLQVVKPKSEKLDTVTGRLYPLIWEPASMEATRPNNFSTPVARQTANLFCTQFCQLPDVEIGQQFEAPIGAARYRLNHVSFVEDTAAISAAIEKEKGFQKNLSLSLGISAPFADHPYPIRPVLTVIKVAQTEGKKEESECTNFEFSRPCPPACGGDD